MLSAYRDIVTAGFAQLDFLKQSLYLVTIFFFFFLMRKEAFKEIWTSAVTYC